MSTRRPMVEIEEKRSMVKIVEDKINGQDLKKINRKIRFGPIGFEDVDSG